MIKRRLLTVLMAMMMVVVMMPFAAGNVYAKGKDGKNLAKDAAVSYSTLTFTYDGTVQKPTVTVKIGQTVLVEGTDYKVDFKNPSSVNAGSYQMTINGIGNYSGKVNTKYTINPKAITPVFTMSKKTFVYNGDIQKPTVIAVLDGTVKVADADYSVAYGSGCKDVGSYTVTVTMKGNYTGAKTAKYKINPKGTSLKKPERGSKYIKVKWGKQSALMSKSRISGYQLKLATNSKFTKNKKTVTVKGYSKTSKKVTKLKGGKKYYIKIRTYKVVNGVRYYSKWSKVRTAVTKK